MGNQFCGKDGGLCNSIQKNQYSIDNQIFNKNIPEQCLDIIKIKNLLSWKQKEDQKYFSGKFQNGMAQGFGIIYIPDYLLYQGNFHLGYPHGQGKINFMKRLQIYQGNFQSGMAHGCGKYYKYTQNNAFHFNGQWKNSQPLRGVFIPVNNQQVESIQMQNFQNGDGIIKFKNGNLYTGKLNSHLEPHGGGSLKYNSQSKVQFYSGQWKRGKFHGSGNCKWKDGSSYIGQYVNGEKQGHGTYRDKSGDFYEGSWSGGRQQGKGIIVSDGNKKEALWIAGLPLVQVSNNEFPKTNENEGKYIIDNER